MTDTEERLAKVEERLRQMELGVKPAPQPAPAVSRKNTLVALVAWTLVTLIGVVIWYFADRIGQ